jgi:hypothetical protein
MSENLQEDEECPSLGFFNTIEKKQISILLINVKNKIKGVFINPTPFLHLINEFASANIPLKLVYFPAGFSTKNQKASDYNESFLMYLRRDDGEYIIIFTGIDTNIKVHLIDRKLSQLVLSIKETERNTEVITRFGIIRLNYML